jgi:hypothetical protein
VVYVQSRPADRPSVPPSPTGVAVRPADQHPAATVSLVGVRTAEQLMTQLAVSFGKAVHPHWEHLPLRPDSAVRFELPSAEANTVIRLLNSQYQGPLGGVIDYRLFPGHVEVATQDYFDRQEIKAVNYDLAALVRSVQSAAAPGVSPTEQQIVQSIISTIEQNVAMEAWYDNGGDLAQANVIGSGLLISAPDRFHPQIAWVLEQIERTPGWTTGLQRLLAPVTSAAAGTSGAGAGPGSNTATPPGPGAANSPNP